MLINNPTDKEIIKALEFCVRMNERIGYIDEPVRKCKVIKFEDILALVTIQQAEIARLEKTNGVLLCQKDAMEANCIALQKQLEEVEE